MNQAQTKLADAFRQAAENFLGGRFDEAFSLCRQILAAAPGHTDSLNLLARIALARGDAPFAVNAAKQAVTTNAKIAIYWVTLAQAYGAAGEAAQAEDSFKKAIAFKPPLAEAQFAYGSFLFNTRRPREAAAAFERALKISARMPEAQSGLGLARLELGELDAALKACRAAVTLSPNFADAHLNLGMVQRRRGEIDDALGSYKRALQIRPSFPDAYNNLGSLCYDQNRYDEALTYTREALRLKPDMASAHVNLGLALRMLGRFKEAKESFACAIALKPDAVDAHVGLGMIAEMENKIDDSLAHYHRALEISPDYPSAHYNKAISLLRRGELEEGWPALEWRWKTSFFTARPRPFAQPLWQGEKDFEGKLLVWGEQGVGDEILYAGMIPDLVARGVNLVIECDPRLVSLFGRTWPQAAVVARAKIPAPETADPNIKFQTPMGSLPRWLRADQDSFPSRSGFLTPDWLRRQEFHARLGGKDQRRPRVVGISWISKNLAVGAKKSSALADWMPLLRQSGTRFVDLQYGDTAAERAAAHKQYGLELTHFEDLDLFNDLDGLAALISACDMVITVSNTTAHLAAALGIPTWVLVPATMGLTWYWFNDRADSPWYPSVRLFRQKTGDDWRPVVKQVAKDFGKLP